MKKTILLALTLCLSILQAAASAFSATFNFNDPASLNPPVAPPAQKGSVPLDGRSFTDGDVTIQFFASETGNTHVRIYNSYDAGCDARIYDEEQLAVECAPGFNLDSIAFTMSLSGIATGASDINFIPDLGTYVWEENMWYAPQDATGRVLLTSYQQSRIASMTVYYNGENGIVTPSLDESACPLQLFTTAGIPVTNPSPGLYIARQGSRAWLKIVK